jgi:ABC-type polysaccharide/polyol phosphate transport system ATPase subunit
MTSPNRGPFGAGTTQSEAKPVITFEHVSKIYKLFGSRQQQVMDGIGLSRLLPVSKRPKFGEFHALRSVSFSIKSGERVGIIGRNGAGKTTLLRLITQNFGPTRGRVKIDGSVQALMQLGLGFHPEFTGRENIVASLNYNGLVGSAFDEALAEVIEFVELGDFLDQPVKAYSLGMQARLQFAAATAIRPKILIVDEVLGAGDAYFAAKSAHRMKKLATSGCTLLLVSHATSEILRFCQRVIWIHQGAILMDGPALDVVRVYEAYIEELNFRMRKQTDSLWGDVDQAPALPNPEPAESVPSEPVPSASAAASEAELARDGVFVEAPTEGAEETQLATPDALVDVNGNAGPEEGAQAIETLQLIGSASGSPEAEVFTHPALERSSDLERERAALSLQEGEVQILADMREDEGAETEGMPLPGWQRDLFSEMLQSDGETPVESFERWPGEPGLKISRMRILDSRNRLVDRVRSGDPVTFECTVSAELDGDYRFRLSILFMTLEGVGACRNFSPYFEHRLAAGEKVRLRLHMHECLLAGREYVFSAALFKYFDMVDSSTAIRYDLLSRAFRLRVDGRLAHDPGLYHQPGEWAAAAVTRDSRRLLAAS